MNKRANERMTDLIRVLSWKIFSSNSIQTHTFTRTYFPSLVTFENDRHPEYFKTYSRLLFILISLSFVQQLLPRICEQKLLKLHSVAAQPVIQFIHSNVGEMGV